MKLIVVVAFAFASLFVATHVHFVGAEDDCALNSRVVERVASHMLMCID